MSLLQPSLVASSGIPLHRGKWQHLPMFCLSVCSSVRVLPVACAPLYIPFLCTFCVCSFFHASFYPRVSHHLETFSVTVVRGSLINFSCIECFSALFCRLSVTCPLSFHNHHVNHLPKLDTHIKSSAFYKLQSNRTPKTPQTHCDL